MSSHTHNRTHSHRGHRTSAEAVKRSEQARRNLAMVTGGFGAFFRHGHGHHGHGMHGHCGGGQPPTGQAPGMPAPAGGAAVPGGSSGTPSSSS